MTCPVTCPEMSSEARTTTWRATSSATATLRSGIVRVIRWTSVVVDRAARHRRVRPARRDHVDAGARSDAHDLVLQAEQQPVCDRGLRRRVVGVAGLAEEPGGRADHDQAAVAASRRRRAGNRARSGTSRSGSPQRRPPTARAAAPRRARPGVGQTPATAAQTSSAPASANRCSTSASLVRSAWTSAPPISSCSASARSLPRW